MRQPPGSLAVAAAAVCAVAGAGACQPLQRSRRRGAATCHEDDNGSLYRIDFDYGDGHTETARLSIHGCQALELGDPPVRVAYAMTAPPELYAGLKGVVLPDL